MSSSDSNSGDILAYNRKFKKSVLDMMFTICDTFYIHCIPDPSLFMGTRGLIDREKTDGIILVFGPYSTRHLTWDEQFIHCEMQFNRWEKVSIPFECIARMFDKSGQVIMQWQTMSAPIPSPAGQKSEPNGDLIKTVPPAEKKDGPEKSNSRVIEVDFSKKKK